jgi:AcrR family transcriptional regulator
VIIWPDGGAPRRRPGLERVTIGRLAEDLGMSKAGLYGHFGSKERLQLETVALGREIFVRHVVAPAQQEPPGLPRLSSTEMPRNCGSPP